MLVRRLTLKNIRSYNDGEETAIDLPEGVVLFEGDIGSGKSTLLHAIEFALFGFSDLRGSHLLSERKQSGRVSITFESGGTEYTILRHLRARGEEVFQEDCYIYANGEKTKLSPSDLKERVVSVLGFNEPTHPKAESLVYRYAVFTPQEKMKEILAQNPEDRMHVIRRILGAQGYQIAAENSETIERAIKEIAHGLNTESEDLEAREEELKAAGKRVGDLETELPKLKDAEAQASRLVITTEAEWKQYLGQKEALGRAEAAVPRLRDEISEVTDEINDQEQTLRELEARLAEEIVPVIKGFEGMPKQVSEAGQIRSRLDSERERLAQLTSSKATLEGDLKRTKDLVARGVCPLCGQKISGDISARSQHSEQELTGVETQMHAATTSVASLTAELERATAYESAESDYARALKDENRINTEIEAARRKLRKATAKLAQRQADLSEASSQIREMSGIYGKLTELQRKLDDARELDKQASLGLSRAQADLENGRKDLVRLNAEVAKMRAAWARSKHLGRYQLWLSSFFRPTVKLIESQTLIQAAARFNEHFQRFFASLVDDPDMVVRVREDFTPVFERQGFEQDYEALSGGERTSMALAYRFALNSVVRESIMAQPELVILDEPTDGFSKEQIYKMRGLLEELDSRQVILVSHEKELESMADHIYRVEKRNGTSTVAALEAHA
ncbi:MAG TPA: SMC family ATPase [Nitrososphaerales archaeon]|nr:SMC family ATPase [Nitrososphaerales archaeon]